MTLASTSRRYSWTTSSPATGPVLVTSTLATTDPFGLMLARSRDSSPSANVAYDNPNPKGHSGRWGPST